MSRLCQQCKRQNPSDAVFCYFDGVPMNGHGGGGDGSSINFSTLAFPTPFVLLSGQKCHNFLQLALACRSEPRQMIDIMKQGFLESFFGSLGRMDLAMAARAAAKAPDTDRGLDDLLGKFPGSPLADATLEVEPVEKNLGVLAVGKDVSFDLKLTNKGDRLLYGKAVVEDSPWLVLGENRAAEKLVQFFDSATLRVQVRGDKLRAYHKPQTATIVVETNGGNVLVTVEVMVRVKPFTEGILAGAASPRELAAKAKLQPKEACVLIENGAVRRWYEVNGWSYPVQGPTAAGVAAVQQLFEVLGLVKPPKMEIDRTAVELCGKPGERLEAVVVLQNQEKRPSFAHAVSDQPWLTICQPTLRGQTASLPLVVEATPAKPGQTLKARVKVTTNGNQLFDVPVTLAVAGSAAPPYPGVMEVNGAAAAVTTVNPFDFSQPAYSPGPVPMPAPAAYRPEPPLLPGPPVPPGVSPTAALVPTTPPQPPGARPRLLLQLLPVGLVLVGLLTAVLHDVLFREQRDLPMPEIDPTTILDVRFHDVVKPDDWMPSLSMTFGLGIVNPQNPGGDFKTKLIFDEWGRTCNVVVRIDNSTEYLWGIEQGAWKEPIREALGEDPATKRRLNGVRSTWRRTADPLITITQTVEIVPGGLSADGSKRLLDTCLVTYDIVNEDKTRPHTVGLRFLLDTKIGANDGVPFTIGGAKELCNTMKVFDDPASVPDYISALERQDLNNPGTVAHLTLRYGGLEPPKRVTLGAWPHRKLASPETLPGGEGKGADGQDTRWAVPVVPMKLAADTNNKEGDSAVTMYWEDKPVVYDKARKIGFAYGLGSVSGDKGQGQLLLQAGGQLVANEEFTLTALVKNPTPGMTATLGLPRGLQLTSGTEKETVPLLQAGSPSPYSPVTWRVKASRNGIFRLRLSLSTGATLEHRIVVNRAPFIFN